MYAKTIGGLSRRNALAAAGIVAAAALVAALYLAQAARATAADADALDWSKGEGLLPAIVQDADTGSVLMLGMRSKDFSSSRKRARLAFTKSSTAFGMDSSGWKNHYAAGAALRIGAGGSRAFARIRWTSPLQNG